MKIRAVVLIVLTALLTSFPLLAQPENLILILNDPNMPFVKVSFSLPVSITITEGGPSPRGSEAGGGTNWPLITRTLRPLPFLTVTLSDIAGNIRKPGCFSTKEKGRRSPQPHR